MPHSARRATRTLKKPVSVHRTRECKTIGQSFALKPGNASTILNMTYSNAARFSSSMSAKHRVVTERENKREHAIALCTEEMWLRPLPMPVAVRGADGLAIALQPPHVRHGMRSYAPIAIGVGVHRTGSETIAHASEFVGIEELTRAGCNLGPFIDCVTTRDDVETVSAFFLNPLYSNQLGLFNKSHQYNVDSINFLYLSRLPKTRAYGKMHFALIIFSMPAVFSPTGMVLRRHYVLLYNWNTSTAIQHMLRYIAAVDGAALVCCNDPVTVVSVIASASRPKRNDVDKWLLTSILPPGKHVMTESIITSVFDDDALNPVSAPVDAKAGVWAAGYEKMLKHFAEQPTIKDDLLNPFSRRVFDLAVVSPKPRRADHNTGACPPVCVNDECDDPSKESPTVPNTVSGRPSLSRKRAQGRMPNNKTNPNRKLSRTSRIGNDRL